MSNSMVEEIIGCLWFIIAAILWTKGHEWFACGAFMKGALDQIAAIVLGYIEVKKEMDGKLTFEKETL